MDSPFLLCSYSSALVLLQLDQFSVKISPLIMSHYTSKTAEKKRISSGRVDPTPGVVSITRRIAPHPVCHNAGSRRRRQRDIKSLAAHFVNRTCTHTRVAMACLTGWVALAASTPWCMCLNSRDDDSQTTADDGSVTLFCI